MHAFFSVPQLTNRRPEVLLRFHWSARGGSFTAAMAIALLLGGRIPAAPQVDPSWSALDTLSSLALQDESHHIVLHYRPDLAAVINVKVKGEWFEIEGYSTRLASVRLSAQDTTEYVVDYNPGASNDPSFELHRERDGDMARLARLPGLEIWLPGNGALYVAGHTNSMFTTCRKYLVRQDHVEEVRQPVYAVDLDTRTRAPLILYADTVMAQVVEQVRAGEPVSVLASQGDWFLLRTWFGLAGWARITQPWDGPVEGLYWAGD